MLKVLLAWLLLVLPAAGQPAVVRVSRTGSEVMVKATRPVDQRVRQTGGMTVMDVLLTRPDSRPMQVVPDSELPEVKHMLAGLRELEREPKAPSIRRWFAVRYGDLREIQALLATLVPDVSIEVDLADHLLACQGAPGSVDQVHEYLAELDRPVDSVRVKFKLIKLLPAGRQRLGLDSPRFTFPWSQPGLPPVQVACVPGWGNRVVEVIASNLDILINEGQARLLTSSQTETLTEHESEVQFPLIGLKLQVTPTIRADGFINLKAELEIEDGSTALVQIRVNDGDTVSLTWRPDTVLMLTPHNLK